MEHSQKAGPLGKKKKCYNKGKGEDGKRGEGKKRRKNVKKSEWKMHFLEEYFFSSHKTRSLRYANK